MYASYKNDPDAFAQHYAAMMRNGYTAPPDVLLARFFGIDLNDPSLLSGVVKLLDDRVAHLKSEYAR
jgi:oligoendopeptidase F